MAVGQGASVGYGSYISIGRETTYGTYVTGTAGLGFLSANMKLTKEVKILEEIQASRTNSNSIQLGRSLEGDIEFYWSAKNPACNYLLHNAFGGGAISSATATGDTVGSACFTHTVSINDFNSGTYNSLSMNHRKGETTTGKIFEYKGLRINEFSLSAELDEALKCSVSLIGQDASISTNDISGQAGVVNAPQDPLSFINGRFSIENTLNSLTTASFWHVQNINFKVSNNLKNDNSARRIGSDVITNLPTGMAQFELSCQVRFDTTTAYDALVAGTRLFGEFEFLGDTLTGSKIRQGIKMQFPYLLVTDFGDPEVGSGSDVLVSNITFAVLRDPTTSGYAVKAYVNNATTSY